MLPILDTIISVVFVFLMFSLVVSAAREVIASWLSLRGKELEAGLLKLVTQLGDHTLRQDFLNHAYIKTLKVTDRFPSYIPSANIASALLHIADGNRDGQAVNIMMLKTKLAALPYKELSTILATIIEKSGANATLETVEANVEKWVDDVMERIGSVYQRKTRLWLMLASLALAAVMNIDTVTIWQRAVSDKTMRDSLVALASKVPTPDFIKDAPADGKPTPSTSADKSVKAATQNYQENLKALTDLGLPIGWTPENIKFYTDGDWKQDRGHSAAATG